jgi:REP element-mobilizing transposase RayT
MNASEPNPGLDRVRHELRASGVRDFQRNSLRSGVHSRGYLPHVKREGATYFVTYRLADSLPKEVLVQLERTRAERIRALLGPGASAAGASAMEEEVNRDFRRELERFLDSGHGACHLRRPDVAALVADNLRHFDGQRYQLGEWVVMPNHVHVLVWPMPGYTLSEILKTWKQYTSRRAKALLGLGSADFWQPESYDHWVRDDEERARIARYIRNNPVKAGLCQQPEAWRWSSAWRATTTP